MAIRVYPPQHPLMHLRTQETPGLPLSLSEWISGYQSVPGHLLYSPTVDSEHFGNLGIVYKVLNRRQYSRPIWFLIDHGLFLCINLGL